MRFLAVLSLGALSACTLTTSLDEVFGERLGADLDATVADATGADDGDDASSDDARPIFPVEDGTPPGSDASTKSEAAPPPPCGKEGEGCCAASSLRGHVVQRGAGLLRHVPALRRLQPALLRRRRVRREHRVHQQPLPRVLRAAQQPHGVPSHRRRERLQHRGLVVLRSERSRRLEGRRVVDVRVLTARESISQ